jgi:hypothetical protein
MADAVFQASIFACQDQNWIISEVDKEVVR